MKILYHHRIASKDGQYVHVEEMISALRNLGHEVVVVEPKGLTQKTFGRSSGAVKTLRSVLPGFAHELLELGYSLFDFIKLGYRVFKEKPDCIYERYNLFFVSGIWVKKIFRLPLILEVNAPLFLERNKNHGISLAAVAQWTERYAWKNADYVLPVTAVLGDILIENGVAASRCRVIPNGIDAKKFNIAYDVESLRDRLNLNNRLVLGFVGFVRTWHRLDRVLTAISQNPDKNWHLLLIGDGPAREELEQQAAQLGISDYVTFTGVIDRHEVAQYIALFDIALQPDVVEYASPLKLFEYMMLGRAILAPNRKNILEVLTDEQDALLFNPEDEISFFKQLERLCQDNQLRLKLGEQAKQTMIERKLFWDENAQRVTALFNQLLSV